LDCEAGVALSRFAISADADRDLDEILDYLNAIPERPALSVLSAIEKALFGIAEYPYRGALQSELTRLAGVEVRSRLVQQYRIFYIVGGALPEIVDVIHTARDVAEIMARRLQ
jgi:plasmid stabilization system protein ParE